jgi:hypothetical protein
MELEYGKWCTVAGKRYMITDWTKNRVQVTRDGGYHWFDRSVVTEVSDFLLTPQERKAAGYAF